MALHDTPHHPAREPGSGWAIASRMASPEELQVTSISKTAPILSRSGAVLCAATVACLWSTIPLWLLLPWAALTALVLGIVPLLVHGYEEGKLSTSEVLALRNRVIAACILRACVWGVGAALFYPYADPIQLVMLSVLVIGNAMGTGAALMAIPVAATAYGLCVVSPLAVSFMASGELDHIVVGVLLLTFSAGMGLAAKQVFIFVESEADMRKTLINQQGQLVQARMEAETADRSKSDFLAHMSHELRTPLNAILGFSELITHAPYGPVGDQRYTEFANDIQVSGRHLLKLINDILDLSKIEAGALTLDEATVSISEVFQVVERLTGERAGRKALKTHWSPGEGLPLVRTDERILSQILINLVTNAIKFTGSPGRVDVSAQLQADGTIALTVSDTGIGMREGDIELALKPFGQVSDNMTSRAEGTGLGLPLCDRFTQALGGTFEITSVYGKGTTVTVRLPASSVIKGNPIPGPRERARA